LLKISFTSQAKADLDELHAYLLPISPSGLSNVVAAIERKIRQSALHPGSGRLSPREDVRETIEPKYGFLIPYYVEGETLYVLRIYRGVRKPLDYDGLKVK
jgi:toxin ParE1/3/4